MGIVERRKDNVPEMKPTPRSARMGAIADALMAARNWADKAKVPEAVPLVGGQGLGSLVLGKAPEELTEMSYGNMPMRVNPLAGRTASYVPEMKPGRKEQVADLAMLAGTPKVGKAGLGLAGGTDDVGRAALAFHGTPHKFAPEPELPLGRFRAEKIGSGEGAQAYGYGIYFAEAPGTAKVYQEKLSGRNPNIFLLGNKEVSIVGGSPEWKKFNEVAKEKGFSTESAALAYNKLKESKGNLDLASGELTWIDNPTKIHDDAANLLRSMDYKPQGGSFYTVDIPDEMVGKMLDWDKPLKDQPSNVKKALGPLAKQLADERNQRRIELNKQNPERTKHPVVSKVANKEIKPDDIKGSELYEFATQLNKKPEPPPSWTSVSADTDTRAWSGQKATSAYLKDLGIPGIRYLDRQSRDVKEGTRNIVVFPGEEDKVKILKRDGDETKMAKGGMMNRSIPGFQDGGNAVEPTTGNDVPIGSLPNEVADDIPARLSEGEFVLSSDVVRFIGLERLMKLRDEAKEGLRRMAEVGQMGNAEDVGEKAEESFEEEEDTGKFESDIDEILAEVDSVEGQTEQMMADGGVVGTKTGKTTTAGRPVYKTKEGDNVSELSVTVPFKGFWANVPSIHNGVKYKEDQIVEMLEKGTIKPTSVHENISEAVEAAKKRSSSLMPKMAQGGVVGGAPWLTGFDLKRAPKNPVFDVRYYKHPDGRIMYVTFFNGKPMTPIPDGFTPTDKPVEQQVGKEAEAKKAEEQKQMPDVGGGIGANDGGGAGAGVDVGAISRGDESALATGTTVSPGAVKGAAAIGALVGIPGALAFAKNAENIANALSMASGKMAGQQNIDAVGKAFGFDTSTVEGKAAASSVIDSMSARAGSATDQVSAEQGGRGGTAAAAGASAAAAAAEAGLSAAAQGQASRDAASAVLAGTDAESAVANAVSAAIDAAQGGSTVGVDALGPSGTGGYDSGVSSAASGGVSAADGVGMSGFDGTGNFGGGDYGSGYGFGDGSGLGYKKGGLVSKRQKPMKKPKGKGLAAR